MRPFARRFITAAALPCALLPLALVCTGCVERTLTITSEPTGALITLGDNEVGRTPLETSIKYHGTYDVLVTLDGYEPLRTTATAQAPLYEYPGPDLVAEVLPFTFHNEQAWHFVLEPRLESSGSQAELEAGMLQRAAELRTLLDATEPPPPPSRPGLDGSLDEEVPAEASPAPATEPVAGEPADEPVSEPAPPAIEPPRAPIGTMTPMR